MKRAIRRHHRQRLIDKRRKNIAWATDKTKSGLLANTPTPCSCFMCGNPRKYHKTTSWGGKLTNQEKKQDTVESNLDSYSDYGYPCETITERLDHIQEYIECDSDFADGFFLMFGGLEDENMWKNGVAIKSKRLRRKILQGWNTEWYWEQVMFKIKVLREWPDK